MTTTGWSHMRASWGWRPIGINDCFVYHEQMLYERDTPHQDPVSNGEVSIVAYHQVELYVGGTHQKNSSLMK